ncbi:hypothetical protein UlMin_017630 [Ulmus minor]
MILFKKFGFTCNGHVTILVQKVSVGSNSNINTDLSRLGFFLLSKESLLQLCILDSHYIIHLFTFQELSPPPLSLFNYLYPVTAPNEYSLFFANCAPGTSVTMAALNLICAAEDKHYVKFIGTPHGWDVLFYIFQFIHVILLFTVVTPRVLRFIINHVIANLAYVVIGETRPFIKDWVTWNQIFLLLDIICCCTIFEIICSGTIYFFIYNYFMLCPLSK